MSDSNEDTNEPAFPVNEMGLNDSTQLVHQHFGMSLRDWFAGMALQGIVASGFAIDGNDHSEAMSHDAYTFADAMLEARKQVL